MKIVVICRTLNEESLIADFCNNHQFANLILIADGGSTDKTKQVAKTYFNVKVKDFTKQIDIGGVLTNPESEHINFLINWAIVEQADWILLDDADSWPNLALQKDARKILERTNKSCVLINRFYMWKQDHYFPKINEAGPGLWGWNPRRIDIHWPEGQPTMFETVGPMPDNAIILKKPYAGLHYFCHNREEKLKRYAAWGHPQLPLENGIYWPPELLPEWV